MENERLEQLFKDKLAGMVIEPSRSARDNFAGKIKIQKQKTLIRRISIAASILLVALAGIYGFFPDTKDKTGLSQDGSSIMDQVGEVDQARISDEVADADLALSSSLAEDSDKASAVQQAWEMPVDESIIEKENSDDKVLADSNITSKEEEPVNTVMEEPETETLIADHADENVYVEYFIEEPGAGSQSSEASYEPIKITIEYIASGNSNDKQQSKLKEFYARMDNMKGMDEVYGDLREYKDRLFALDFMNNKKVKNEEK